MSINWTHPLAPLCGATTAAGFGYRLFLSSDQSTSAAFQQTSVAIVPGPNLQSLFVMLQSHPKRCEIPSPPDESWIQIPPKTCRFSSLSLRLTKSEMLSQRRSENHGNSTRDLFNKPFRWKNVFRQTFYTTSLYCKPCTP